MNIDRLRELRDFIASEQMGFRMNQWLVQSNGDFASYHTCGTAGCIAGSCYVMMNGSEIDDPNFNYWHTVRAFAAEALELEWAERDELFVGSVILPNGKVVDLDLKEINRADTLAVLDYAIAHGQIDWLAALGSKRFSKLLQFYYKEVWERYQESLNDHEIVNGQPED